MTRTMVSDVAVIVATRNEEPHLPDCVDSLLVAGRGGAELIFVDDGSTDRSLEILAPYGDRIRVIRGEGRGPGRARNLALKATNRPWIAFTDADCVVPPDWLELMLEGIRGAPDSVASIGGDQQVSRKASPRERFFARFLESVGFVSDYLHAGTEIRSVLHNPTCNVLYRKSALDAVGGFDESLWPCEDLDLDLRLKEAGRQALFHPGASVEHRRPGTFRSFFRMMRRYGFAHAQLVKKRGHCQKLHLLPYAAPVVILLFLWLTVLSPFWGGAALGASFLGLSLFLGIPSALLLPIVVLSWLIGFYSGLPGERRIAR